MKRLITLTAGAVLILASAAPATAQTVGMVVNQFRSSVIVWKAICQDFPPFRHTPPVVFTWPSILPAYAGTGLRRRSSIRLKIFRNNSLGTATSANWNVMYRP